MLPRGWFLLCGKHVLKLKKEKLSQTISWCIPVRTNFAELSFSMIQSLVYPETQHCIICKCVVEDAVHIPEGLPCRLMGCIYF